MCGILGSLHPRYTIRDPILSALHHRGPDASGLWQQNILNKPLSLGHTRLSILDQSEAGAQPMTSHNQRWVITFNGEIYNHHDIRSALTEKTDFKGHSDTETLLESISQLGVHKSVELLNGMFAFAALDTHTNKLYLARDPFGIKPLYYHIDAQGICFASEIKPLLKMGVPKDISAHQLNTFLQLQYIPSPDTLISAIKRLPPGELLTWDIKSNRYTLERYIKPTKHRYCGSLPQAINDYETELECAVQRQLLSDVPVGILLSGGIDSALVAAMAAKNGSRPQTFTVGFGKEHWECEIDDAAHTAQVLGLPHRSVSLVPDRMWDSLPALTASLEEPVGTTSILAMWELVKLAKQEVTVVLTGQGTDEPWGGYRRYQQEVLRPYLPSFLWKGLQFLPDSKKLPEYIRRTKRSIPHASEAARFLTSNELFSPSEQAELMGHLPDNSYAINKFQGWLDWISDLPLSPVEKMMRVDTRMKLSDDLLLYGDKMSMAFALEARVPMLDIELMQFVESLPIKYRLGIQKGKIVHKAMAEKYLPPAIVHRPKKGFYVPIGEWAKNEWKDRIYDSLFSEGPHEQWLNTKAVQQIWDAHQKGQDESPRRIFALIMFVFWTRWVSEI